MLLRHSEVSARCEVNLNKAKEFHCSKLVDLLYAQHDFLSTISFLDESNKPSNRNSLIIWKENHFFMQFVVVMPNTI